VQWEDNWKGQFLIQEINFKMLFIQPTFSYKLNEKFGIGLGLIYATGNYSLRKAIAIQDTTGNYGGANLKGNANGMGFNIGIYFKANEKLSIGIDYRSAVNAAIKSGTADFTVASSAANDYHNTTFSTNLNLPQVFSLGLGYVVNSKFKLALDINYTGWEIHDSMIIDFSENSKKLKDAHEATMYENSFTFRIGGQYLLTKKWATRLGAYYDLSPVKNGYFTPETSDTDKLGITVGATYHVTKKVNIDISMIYIEGMKRTDTNINTQFGGSYKTKTVLPGISLEYVF
ncbi:MAG: outer membrane protein transport protein, partial [Bacteroidetes bacterium]|nr:outer membrane protein transport protein [Bacteroidota bacterium]